jgi:hypothetical protein
MFQEDISEKARKRVNAKKAVYIHVTAVIAASILLVVLTFLIGEPFHQWIMFPILPMILSIFIHYVVVFGLPFSNVMSEEWEEREMAYEEWKLRNKSLPPGEEGDEDQLVLNRRQKERRLMDEDDDFV